LLLFLTETTRGSWILVLIECCFIFQGWSHRYAHFMDARTQQNRAIFEEG